MHDPLAYRQREGMRLRLRHALEWLPLRSNRILLHIRHFCWRPRWWVELLFLFFDLLALPEWIETVQDILFTTQRPLTEREFRLLYQVFGDTLPYARIRIDTEAHVGPRTHRLYYVQCCTINSWGQIPDPVLVHEAVHVWQFMQVGSVYIPRALRAQASTAGYNYGGEGVVRQAALSGNLLFDFNYEQQADLIADGWAIAHGHRPSWGRGTTADLPFYQYFADQLQREEATKK